MPSEHKAGNVPYDIVYKSSREPDWDNDFKLGKDGEALLKNFLDSLDNASFEVKNDQFRNGKMVVEMEQNYKETGWKPSGLATTTAKWWVYVYSPASFVAVSVERLKRYIKINDGMQLKLFAAKSYNPTKGYLLLPEDVNKLMSSELYD